MLYKKDDVQSSASPAMRWKGDPGVLQRTAESIYELLGSGRPLFVVHTAAGPAVTDRGAVTPEGDYLLSGLLAPVTAHDLGSRRFRTDFGLQYSYMAGAMANGISSAALVNALGSQGLLGSFGSGGLSLAAIEAAIGQMRSVPGGSPFCMNFLHAPAEPHKENDTISLYLKHGINIIACR